MIEIALVTLQLALEVNGVPKEDLVKQFSPETSDQPFHEGMRNWRVRNRFEFVYLKNAQVRLPLVIREQRIIV